MTTASNVVAMPNGRSGFSLAPQSLDEALRFADILSKSSIVPKDYQGNAGNILVAVQWGAELGLPPLQAMQNIAVINGRPAVWGDAIIALVRASGLLESIDEDIGDTAATCTVKRRGEPAISRTFTREDAKVAGLLGKQGPWQQYPKRMMQMRARGWALRDAFADVLRGVHVGEEAQDMPPEPKNMGPVEEVAGTTQATPPKPASRADKARAALSRSGAPALPAPALMDVLTQIRTAATLDALQATGELAARLETDVDKAAARSAYAERKTALMSSPKQGVTVDNETGEIDPPAKPASKPAGAMDDHADFLNELNGQPAVA